MKTNNKDLSVIDVVVATTVSCILIGFLYQHLYY